MKKIVSIVLLIMFFSVVGVPREAKAGDGAQGALIGAGIGAVIGLVWWAVSPKEESSKKTTEKADETVKAAKNVSFVPENRADSFESDLKKNNGQPTLLYSFSIGF